MTQRDLEILQSMTVRQIISKYLPKLRDGEINKEQYMWLLRQGSTLTRDKVYNGKELIEKLCEEFDGKVII